MTGKIKLVMAVLVFVFAGFFLVEVASAAPTPKKDTLTVVITDDIGTLDPNDNVGFSHHQVTRQIYETLVVRDKNGKLVPWLAESWKYENPETLIIKIRKGVKFHNGEELKAGDVLFTFKRMANDNSTGLINVNRIDLQKSAVVDDYTLKIVTKGVYVTQMAMLENPLACIINEKAYNNSNGDFNKAPIGTGPYKFVSRVSGSSVTLVANEKYWIKNQPYVKNVLFRVISDSSSRAVEAETGGADIIVDIGANDVERVKELKNVKLVSGSGMNTSYICFNTAKKPLDNIKVREAIWYAVDVPTAIKIAYGNFGKLADGFVSPGVEGRHPDLRKWFVKRDINKAKQLLSEAGYKNGLTLHISCENSNQQRMDFCEAIQAQLKEAGINLVLDFMEVNAWVQKVTNGEAELAVYGFTASSGEAGRIMIRFMKGMGESRIFNWYEDKYQETADKAFKTLDTKERNKLFYKCQEILMAARIALPIWHKELNAATQKDVKGFRLTTTYEHHYLQNVKYE